MQLVWGYEAVRVNILIVSSANSWNVGYCKPASEVARSVSPRGVIEFVRICQKTVKFFGKSKLRMSVRLNSSTVSTEKKVLVEGWGEIP